MPNDDCLFLVVTGTDTGVGKTWVGAALARELTRRGYRVTAVKPIETGCDASTEATEDGVILATATDQEHPRRALLRLRTPVAPPVAAESEGVEIELDALFESICTYSRSSDVVLVEGAGGLCSPLAWDADLLDLAAALGASVLLVGSDRLGVVNHVVLTINTLLAGSEPFLGVVLTAPETEDASTGTNADTLRRVLGGGESNRGYDRVVTVGRGDWHDAGGELDPVVSWVEEALDVLRSTSRGHEG
jgi:dethiobiotin synthetase